MSRRFEIAESITWMLAVMFLFGTCTATGQCGGRDYVGDLIDKQCAVESEGGDND